MVANNSSEVCLTPDAIEQHRYSNRTDCMLQIDFEALTTCYASIYIFLMAGSFVGNSLLIYACVKTKTIANIIIANIAASDLLFSIVYFPREIEAQIKDSKSFAVHGWIGSLLCKIWPFFTDLSLAVSTLSLVLITIDRCVAAVFPLQFPAISVQKWKFFTLCTWIIAMAIHSPYFYTFRLNEKDGETFCKSNWEPAFDHKSTHTGYYTALLVTVVIVPLVTVCILQTVILVKLRTDKMAPFRTSIANQRNKIRNKRLLKMSVVITSAFALSWLPFTALQLLYLHFPNSVPHCSLSFTIFNQFASLLSLCHCVVNPCICFTFMPRIRIALRCISIVHKQRETQPKTTVCQDTRL